MKFLMLAALFLFPVVHAGIYLDLHRDSYEVLINSPNCSAQEKKYWSIRYETIILKDKLLHLLQGYKASSKKKEEEIERVVHEIDQRSECLYKLKKEIIRRNPDYMHIFNIYTYWEEYDFEDILFKTKGWFQIKGPLYYSIVIYTTINTTYDMDEVNETKRFWPAM